MQDFGTIGNLRLAGFELGPFATNAYVLSNDAKCAVVDCPYGPAELIEYLKHKQLTPSQLILTHAHCDHIGGLPEFRKAFPNCTVRIHSAEAGFLEDPEQNLSAFLGQPVSVAQADGFLNDGETLDLAGQTWNVLHTPGHSPGGITLHAPALGVALVGDALFAGSIGRTDFPHSDFDTLANSIRTRLYTLTDTTRIFPGHGPPSTIGKEKRSNPFVRGT